MPSDESYTLRRLADLTDAGEFERLATAVLRLGDPIYRVLGHTGVNASGKTVRAPVDNVGFVRGASPPHMVTAHHTIGERSGLEAKWLHDPAKVKPRNRTGLPTAPAGDVLKTAKIADEQRLKMPGLEVTLALTCNVEPPEGLSRRVVAEGGLLNLRIDLWPASRIASVLDDDPDGQWLRYRFLGLHQQRISAELLAEITREQVDHNLSRDDKRLRVTRKLHDELDEAIRSRPLTLLMGESGTGKSVACHEILRRHRERGGYGIVVDPSLIDAATRVEALVETALRRVHTELAPGCGAAALAIASTAAPFLIVIEDVNKSLRPELVLERLSGWSCAEAGASQPALGNWRVVCPTWPHWFDLVSDPARKRLEACVLTGGEFLPEEGEAAVERRAGALDVPLSPLDSERMSAALGHDPLLIGLHDFLEASDPTGVIANWIDGSARRLAAKLGVHTFADYRESLDRLAREMLLRRRFSPTWGEVANWFVGGDALAMLRQLTIHAEVIRLERRNDKDELAFRHDRVRDELIVTALAGMLVSDQASDEILAEPFYAEVLGRALARNATPASAVPKAAALNPLALFHAFAALASATGSRRADVVKAIQHWLAQASTHAPAKDHCRWAAMRVLADVDAAEVIPFIERFRDETHHALQASFRNGDLSAGFRILLDVPPGVIAPWRDRQIAHVSRRYGGALVANLDKILRDPAAARGNKVGALRLAGFLGDAALADAVAECWNGDGFRDEDLRDHLWAAMRCSDGDPDRLLEKPCDVWAALPDERSSTNLISRRDDVAAHELTWAVAHAGLPASALDYLGRRARTDPHLRDQIAMLVGGIDDPDAAELAVDLAARRATDGSRTITAHVLGHLGLKERPSTFGTATRDRLKNIWMDLTTPQNLRHAAYNAWQYGRSEQDVADLRKVAPDDSLADAAMAGRLRRGDEEAVPALLSKLECPRAAYWWQIGREYWSNALTAALDEYIGRICGSAALADEDEFWEIITTEHLARLPTRDAERILEKHWSCVRHLPGYIKLALHLATPRFAQLAKEALDSSRDPREALRFLSLTIGVNSRGRLGATSARQIEGLLPHLAALSHSDIKYFRDLSAKRGWHALIVQLNAALPPEDRWDGVFDARAFHARLDAMSEPSRAIWSRSEFDDQVGTTPDATRERLLDATLEWVASRSTLQALELAADMIVHAGTRQHIGRLKLVSQSIQPQAQAEAIMTDAEFAVRMSTLT